MGTIFNGNDQNSIVSLLLLLKSYFVTSKINILVQILSFSNCDFDEISASKNHFRTFVCYCSYIVQFLASEGKQVGGFSARKVNLHRKFEFNVKFGPMIASGMSFSTISESKHPACEFLKGCSDHKIFTCAL